jgi:hypothetical protein
MACITANIAGVRPATSRAALAGARSILPPLAPSLPPRRAHPARRRFVGIPN